MPQTPRRAFFPGSFNPFTTGHLSLVERGLELFDTIVIGVGISLEKDGAESELERRTEPLRRKFDGQPRVEVTHYSGLTADAAKAAGCRFILRGIRNSADFEYERTMADANRMVFGIETVLLPTLPELSMVSSSLVRELDHYGVDTSRFTP